jgi:glycosyltransferase involved in cell wall biosynthesis
MMPAMARRVAIYHNILWARYKGLVFSSLFVQAPSSRIEPSFVQIAETHGTRIGLGSIDLSYHRYPYRLLFKGPVDEISGPRMTVALVRDFFRQRAELIVLPGYHLIGYWALLLMCMILRRKRAVFCDATTFDQPRGSAIRELAKGLFFRRCHGVFCYGLRSKEYVQGYGVEESKITFPCQAAALPHDYNPEQVRGFYRTLTIDDATAPRFTYIGRLAPEKGLDEAFIALKAILSRHPDAHMDLFGSGPMREELIAKTRELELQHAVTFHGTKDLSEIAPSLMRSTALVLPSHSEPWGLVVNEALSYGCPVVVSDHCGCVPELVIDGVTGYSFETGNTTALAAAMEAVIKLAPRRRSIAEQCMGTISIYTPEKAAAQILEGCTRILDGR